MNKTFTLHALAACSTLAPALSSHAAERPNILFVIADDQSYPHASAYGSTLARTPGFDFVAQHGWLFRNAFVTSPGSSPSRASILTGRYPWQIEEAGTHASSFPAEYECFSDILAENGYHTGYTGKGWGPGNWKVSGRKQNPAGPEYNESKLTPPYKGISRIDYADNFRKFLARKEKNQPFYFWVGFNEPHRPYEKDSWEKEGRSTDEVVVPPFLPDKAAIRGDLLDYATEIEWCDSQLEEIIQTLKEAGELENTLIIVTADNGMPYPAAKANCFEYGIHVPLAICWLKEIDGQEVSDELVSSVDLAPTLFEAAGIKPSGKLEGNSLLPYLRKREAHTRRNSIMAGRERHSSARYDNLGYPIRALRTTELLYIRNFHPERWPAGAPCFITPDGELSKMHGAYFDIDNGPAWRFIVNNRDSADIYPYFLRATAKRPYEELYDIKADPGCLHNLIGNKAYEERLNNLRNEMDAALERTRDTRYDTDSDADVWESYPRLDGVIRSFPKPQF